MVSSWRTKGLSFNRMPARLEKCRHKNEQILQKAAMDMGEIPEIPAPMAGGIQLAAREMPRIQAPLSESPGICRL